MSYWEDYRDEALADDWDPPKKKKVNKKKKEEVNKEKKQVPKISSFEVDGYIDFDGNPYLAPHHLTKVHPRSACEDRDYCVIHAPSEHPMRELPLIWNMQERQLERLCPHDFVHPDPDDLRYWVEVVGATWKSAHACCPHNCCEDK